jgi:hypothetical protein
MLMGSRRALAVSVFVLLGAAPALADSTTTATPTSTSTSTPTATATATATATETPTSTTSVDVSIAGPNGAMLKCREQQAQQFLIRGNWFRGDPVAGRKMLEEAIKYRTKTYGYFEGFGDPHMNAHPPRFYAKATTFMGLPIQFNEKAIPALKCVEAALKATHAAEEYHPTSAGGIRFSNTYRGFEVSNHVYGIAIDIEPSKNSCCGCVAPWPDHPLCKNKKLTVYQRMVMPKSWVEVFERYGFYWLGHDVLQDTMHFEFLGDPTQITEPAATTASL